MCKKVLSIVILFVLLFSNCVSVYGEVRPVISTSLSYNIFTNKVKLSMSLENNPGIVGLKLLVYHDNLFKINKITDNDILHGPMYSLFDKDLLLNPYTLMWCDFTGIQESINNTDNGNFVSIEFDLDENDTDVLEFRIEMNPQSTINANDELVGFDVVNCSIELPTSAYLATYDDCGKMTGIRKLCVGDELTSDEENKNYKVFYLSSADYPTCAPLTKE